MCIGENSEGEREGEREKVILNEYKKSEATISKKQAAVFSLNIPSTYII